MANWLADEISYQRIDIDAIKAINKKPANEAVLVDGTWVEVSAQFIIELEAKLGIKD